MGSYNNGLAQAIEENLELRRDAERRAFDARPTKPVVLVTGLSTAIHRLEVPCAGLQGGLPGIIRWDSPSGPRFFVRDPSTHFDSEPRATIYREASLLIVPAPRQSEGEDDG